MISMDPTRSAETLDVRVGRILRAKPNEKARKPAYKLWIDFGELGTKMSSAQLTALYSVEDLIGRQVIAAVNLGTRRVAGFASEVLVLSPWERVRPGGPPASGPRRSARWACFLGPPSSGAALFLCGFMRWI